MAKVKSVVRGPICTNFGEVEERDLVRWCCCYLGAKTGEIVSDITTDRSGVALIVTSENGSPRMNNETPLYTTEL
jgi:hypothetical protein